VRSLWKPLGSKSLGPQEKGTNPHRDLDVTPLYGDRARWRGGIIFFAGTRGSAREWRVHASSVQINLHSGSDGRGNCVTRAARKKKTGKRFGKGTVNRRAREKRPPLGSDRGRGGTKKRPLGFKKVLKSADSYPTEKRKGGKAYKNPTGDQLGGDKGEGTDKLIQ